VVEIANLCYIRKRRFLSLLARTNETYPRYHSTRLAIHAHRHFAAQANMYLHQLLDGTPDTSCTSLGLRCIGASPEPGICGTIFTACSRQSSRCYSLQGRLEQCKATLWPFRKTSHSNSSPRSNCPVSKLCTNTVSVYY
jgi:hypothetical protein